MARPLRLEFPGALFHITVRGNERREIFRDDRDRHHFLDLLGECVDRFDWILTTYALMPNHFHLLIQLTIETLSTGMGWLNGSYTQDFNHRHERVGHLFQGRFKALLVDKDSYSLEVLRYVVLNPVRARIVARPEEFVWTSYRAIVGVAEAPQWLAVDDVLTQFGPTRQIAQINYREFVVAGIGLNRKPWDDLVGQIYLGSQPWLDDVRARIALKPRADEHPRLQRTVGDATMADVITRVARAFSITENSVRNGRGGTPRMVAAWIAWHEGALVNRQIAAGLRLRSEGHISRLIEQCDRELDGNATLRSCVDRCLATGGREKQK